MGTPGRIKDILDTKGGGGNAACSVERMSMLVLDEADRMLDMGFERDIRSIVWQTFGEWPHQTFLYSATWPLDVQGIAGDLLTNSVKITVGNGGNRLTASTAVTQRVHIVESGVQGRMDKFKELMQSFRRGGADAGKRVIVFANMKVTVKKLAKWCHAQGLASDSISGDRSQSQRETTIRKYVTNDE